MSEESTTNLKIVVIEDSATVREILLDALEGIPHAQLAGYAENTEAAKQTLRETRPDLAIVDLELKDGSGLGVLAAVQDAPQEFGNPAMVVFSNYAHPAIQSRCRMLGACAFFDKAFQMDELLNFVSTMAKSAHPGSQAPG